jgi:hypothetical protein
LAETARAIQGVAEQKAQLGRLDEKLEKNLVETERVVQEAAIRRTGSSIRCNDAQRRGRW